MSYRALGIYREPEFSPGKIEADAAILDAVLGELARAGLETGSLDARAFAGGAAAGADIILAMCQGENALRRLAETERAGAIAINSALAIRNCYRDLLAPAGALVATAAPLDARALAGVDLGAPVFIKRGDLHALGRDDVQRAVSRADLQARLGSFAQRGIRFAYVQQEFAGAVIKFYGVSGGAYFSALPEAGEAPEAAVRELAVAAQTAAAALGLEAWGGDAVLSGERFAIIDFNDWPSYSRVRGPAARAIARRAIAILSRSRPSVHGA